MNRKSHAPTAQRVLPCSRNSRPQFRRREMDDAS
nr:MAG TPA: hypothetical protein [Caudoviricetes sp.]